jgi:hypothetical protein
VKPSGSRKYRPVDDFVDAKAPDFNGRRRTVSHQLTAHLVFAPSSFWKRRPVYRIRMSLPKIHSRSNFWRKKKKGLGSGRGPRGCRDRNRPAACANFVFSLIALMAGTLFYQGG